MKVYCRHGRPWLADCLYCMNEASPTQLSGPRGRVLDDPVVTVRPEPPNGYPGDIIRSTPVPVTMYRVGIDTGTFEMWRTFYSPRRLVQWLKAGADCPHERILGVYEMVI